MGLSDIILYSGELNWLKSNKFRTFDLPKKLFKLKKIAEKQIYNGKIRIYGSFAPAHFFTIKVVDKNRNLVVFETGSGNLADYMKILMPVINEFLQNMIVIKIEKMKKI